MSPEKMMIMMVSDGDAEDIPGEFLKQREDSRQAFHTKSLRVTT